MRSCIICLIFGLLLAAGCGGGEDSTESVPPAATSSEAQPSTGEQPAPGGVKQGGTLYLALPEGQNVTWMNPLLSVTACTASNFRIIQSFLYRPLLWLSPEITIDWEKSLASKITPSDNGTRYLIDMKQWQWSDGTPITSADLQAYFYLLRDGAKTDVCLYGFGGMPDLIESINIVDDDTLEVVYKARPQGYFPTWVLLSGLSGMSPLPVNHWTKVCPGTGFESANPTPAASAKLWDCLKKNGGDYQWEGWDVGSGPFLIDRSGWSPGREYPFKRNENFNGQKPSLDKIVAFFEASSTNTFAALKAGTVHVGVVPPSLVPEAEDLSDYTTSPATSWSQSVISLNQHPDAPGNSDELLSDRAVRIALQHGVDQQTIVTDLAHGGWYPEYGPIPPRPDTYVSPRLKDQSFYPFDIEKGNAVLEEAGYELEDGVRAKDGQQLKFAMTYLGGDDTIASVAQLLKETWAQMGIEVSLVSLPYDEFAAKLYDPKNFEMYLLAYAGWGFFPDFYPSGEPMYGCKSPFAVVQGSYCNKELDKLIDESTAFATPEEGQERFNAFQEFIAQEAVNVFLPNGIGVLAVSNELDGVSQNFSSFSYAAELWHFVE